MLYKKLVTTSISLLFIWVNMGIVKIVQSNYNTINDSIEGPLLAALETIANTFIRSLNIFCFPRDNVMSWPSHLFFLDENLCIYIINFIIHIGYPNMYILYIQIFNFTFIVTSKEVHNSLNRIPHSNIRWPY